MFTIIRFNQDTDVVIQNTADSAPHTEKYHEDEIESVDILNASRETLHVQFEDGSVGWVKKRHVDFLE